MEGKGEEGEEEEIVIRRSMTVVGTTVVLCGRRWTPLNAAMIRLVGGSPLRPQADWVSPDCLTDWPYSVTTDQQWSSTASQRHAHTQPPLSCVSPLSIITGCWSHTGPQPYSSSLPFTRSLALFIPHASLSISLCRHLSH